MGLEGAMGATSSVEGRAVFRRWLEFGDPSSWGIRVWNFTFVVGNECTKRSNYLDEALF